MNRFLTRGWLARHALATVLVVVFCGLGYWQLDRAHEGNALSWAYAFEWPLFALFTIALWGREVRDELRKSQKKGPEQPPLTSPFAPSAVDPADPDGTGDPATDEYNRYLAWLAADPGRRPGDYPG